MLCYSPWPSRESGQAPGPAPTRMHKRLPKGYEKVIVHWSLFALGARQLKQYCSDPLLRFPFSGPVSLCFVCLSFRHHSGVAPGHRRGGPDRGGHARPGGGEEEPATYNMYMYIYIYIYTYIYIYIYINKHVIVVLWYSILYYAAFFNH